MRPFKWMIFILFSCISCNITDEDRSVCITSAELIDSGVYKYKILLKNNGSPWRIKTLNDTILIVSELKYYRNEWIYFAPDHFKGKQEHMQPFRQNTYIFFSTYNLLEYDSLTFNLDNCDYHVFSRDTGS